MTSTPVDGTVADMQNALQDVRARHLAVVDAQELLGQAVETARERGATWAEIGAAMDVSRQAAQQRFGKEG